MNGTNAAAEIERLTNCLASANANFEKYERLYYLEKDKAERLTKERDEAFQEVHSVRNAAQGIYSENGNLTVKNRELFLERDAALEALRDLDTLFEFSIDPTNAAFVINAAGNEHLRKVFAKAATILATLPMTQPVKEN